MFWLFLMFGAISTMIYQLGAFSIWKLILVFFFKALIFIGVLVALGLFFKHILPESFFMWQKKNKRIGFKKN